MRARGGLRGLAATVATAVCLFGGLALVAGSLVPRQPVAQMPALSAAPRATARAFIEPGDIWSRSAPAARVAAGPAASRTMRPSPPISLAIPSIGVDSVLQHLGLDAAGGLEVPKPGPHYDEAAWYRHSPTPGAMGPAVLLGHIDSAANGPSVFFRLGELQPGETIAVTRADESVATFTVDAVHRYPKNDFPTELVYGDIDHAGLRILTCGGAFDRAKRSYVDNVVVFASLTHDPVVSTRLR